MAEIVVVVTGDRHWGGGKMQGPEDRQILWQVLDDYHALYGIKRLIEGCARGADRMAEEWAFERGVHNSHFPAEWGGPHGNAAGMIRNEVMAHERPDWVIAFHRNLNQSKGTRGMVDISRKMGLRVDVHPNSKVDYEQLMAW